VVLGDYLIHALLKGTSTIANTKMTE